MRDAARHLRPLPGGLPPGAWERLWPRDVWRREELPHHDLASTLGRGVGIRFGGFAHAFLTEAAKRWAKTRLLTGTSIWSVADYVRDVACFSSWLAGAGWRVAAPADIRRAVLEDYLLWLRAGSGWAPATQQRRVVALRLFLDEQRLDGLAGLPAEARIDAREAPRVDYRPSLAFDEFVFAQLIDPAKLALVPSITTRTAIVLFANTGLRISSVVTLGPEPLERGADGQPYLRYENVKFRNRERLLPIAPDVEGQIRAQQAHNADTYAEPVRWLLPSPPAGGVGGGKGGAFHVSPSGLSRAIKRWVEIADIRDARGGRPRVFPHAFRHQLGTSMVNANVPLPVVQRMLDHSSIEMTAHYARIHDHTLRHEWEKWQQRVNVRGERIALPAEGPAAEAAWMKERLARAKQALPNGFCALPLVQTCPHPNACLSCENFLTDPSFRSQHEQHLERIRDLLAGAEQHSRARQVELLKRDELSLVRILEGLAALEADDAASPPADPGLDLRALASPDQETV